MATVEKRDIGEPTDLSTGKMLFFSIVVCTAFVLAVEGLLAASGFEPLLHREDPYVGFARNVPLFEPDRDPSGAAIYETAENKLRFFNRQHFAAEKPAGTQRAFCIGGSTTYGRPFDDGTSFCGWLRALLERGEPNRWEVVNAGGISYASYRAAAVMEELAERDPDVFLIYTGHNEFLEERTYSETLGSPGWLREVDSLLRRSRSYSGLREMIGDVRRRAANEGRTELPGEVEAILDRSVGPDAYSRDDALHEQVLTHFRFNLERMVEIARNAGAEPVFVVPASNRRDCTPFKSEASDTITPAQRARWREHFERGRDAHVAGRNREARVELQAATRIDPRRADGLYWLGRTLAALGDSEAAARAFDRARDEDVCPLRALGAFADAVREVAARRGVALVDFPAILRRAAADSGAGDPFGSAYFLDHVHPTIEGHRLLAVGILEAMRERALVEAPAPSPADLAIVRDEVLASVDDRKQGSALRNLAKVLSWAGKTEDAARAARRALDRLGEDAECAFILGAHASESRRWEEAIELYREALHGEPGYTKARNNLGIALARVGRLEEAVAAYEQTLRDDPDHGNARYNLANALAGLGRLDAAISQYREVLLAYPNDTDAHYNLAAAYARRGDYAPASEHYRAVLEREPDDPHVHRALAEVLEAGGQPADAKLHREQAQELVTARAD